MPPEGVLSIPIVTACSSSRKSKIQYSIAYNTNVRYNIMGTFLGLGGIFPPKGGGRYDHSGCDCIAHRSDRLPTSSYKEITAHLHNVRLI